MAPKKPSKTKNLVKDLSVSEEKTKKVKGGFNPQPEPPGIVLDQGIKITNLTNRIIGR